MTIDRSAWADAYNLQAAAFEKLPNMGQDAFWVWYHTRQAAVIDKHNNSPLIQNLMLAVFEEIETADTATRQATA